MLRCLFLSILSMVFIAGSALAQPSPVGLWKTIDDETGKPKSMVRIISRDGELSGRIEKLIDPAIPDPPCDQCTDERKDKPILGMQILRRLRQNPDDPQEWTGGDVLDPENGKVYRVRLRVNPDGSKLEVRGYIGAPLFGRTQTWIRIE